MYFCAKRVFLRHLGNCNEDGMEERASFVTNLFKREIVESGEFGMYFGMELTPETLARIDLKKPLFFEISTYDVIRDDWKAYDRSAGYIGLTNRGDGMFMLELYIYPRFRGIGYASEAVEILLDHLFGGDFKCRGDNNEIITAKKVIVPVWTENEMARRFMENSGFECREESEYLQLCFSNDTLKISDRINYYMTKERFERLEAQKKYVYVIKHWTCNGVNSYGYFSTEKEAWDYYFANPHMEFIIEKTRCKDRGQNLENLEDIEVLYRHTVVFDHIDTGWIMDKQLRNYKIISEACAFGHLVVPDVEMESVEVIVESPSNERKNAEEITRDIFSRYMAACGGEISKESAALFNRLLEDHWKSIDNSSCDAV